MFLTIIACRSDISDGRSLLKVKTSSIKLPENYSNFTYCLKTFQENQTDLFLIPRYRNEIVKFDLNTTELDTIYKFNREGPSGILNINGISRVDDTYFISISGDHTYYRFDTNFNYQSKFSLDQLNKNMNTTSIGLISGIRKDIYKLNDSILLIPQRPINRANDSPQQQQQILKESLFLRYDVKANKLDKMDVFLPEDYYDKGSLLLDYTMTKSNEGIIISLMHDNRIIIIANENDVNYINTSQSKNIKKFSNVNSSQDPISFYLNISAYQNIYYDSKNEVYYRIVLLPEDDLNINEVEDMFDIYYRNKLSIMILDRKFNVLDEVTFKEKNKYLVSMMFMGKEGLYISKANPYSSEFREDYLDFDVYAYR